MTDEATTLRNKITTVTTLRYEETEYCSRYNMEVWDVRKESLCSEDCSVCGNRTEKKELFIEGF